MKAIRFCSFSRMSTECSSSWVRTHPTWQSRGFLGFGSKTCQNRTTRYRQLSFVSVRANLEPRSPIHRRRDCGFLSLITKPQSKAKPKANPTNRTCPLCGGVCFACLELLLLSSLITLCLFVVPQRAGKAPVNKYRRRNHHGSTVARPKQDGRYRADERITNGIDHGCGFKFPQKSRD